MPEQKFSYLGACRDIIRIVLIIPFIPIVLGIALFFGWVIGKAREIPEDLNDQLPQNYRE